MSIFLGIIVLIVFWFLVIFFSIKYFLIEDFKPFGLLGTVFFLYFFAKAIWVIAFGG